MVDLSSNSTHIYRSTTAKRDACEVGRPFRPGSAIAAGTFGTWCRRCQHAVHGSTANVGGRPGTTASGVGVRRPVKTAAKAWGVDSLLAALTEPDSQPLTNDQLRCRVHHLVEPGTTRGACSAKRLRPSAGSSLTPASPALFSIPRRSRRSTPAPVRLRSSGFDRHVVR
jgi:hypothetical protein